MAELNTTTSFNQNKIICTKYVTFSPFSFSGNNPENMDNQKHRLLIRQPQIFIGFFAVGNPRKTTPIDLSGVHQVLLR